MNDDSSDVRATLPDHIASMWKFVDTGRVLCDSAVMDMVRALATKTSWNGIADTINEMKATAWVRDVVHRYFQVCASLGIPPQTIPVDLPKLYRLSNDWVKKVYVSDMEKRRVEITRELEAEKGDDILVFDWTKDAAARCGGAWLLNAMDGKGFVLMSQLTKTSAPHEARDLVAGLARRGVHPKVVYVDDECCGAWRNVLTEVWPDVSVRLDGLHAIMRLTRTVVSTQHPWHGQFCKMLSQAVYSYDVDIMKQLQRAWVRAGQRGCVPKHKYVPRIITDAPRIEKSLEATISKFQRCVHAEAGPLLTSETHAAWLNLKEHVSRGCLCDPPGITMHEFCAPVDIGGALFRPVRTLRGASKLEGFHAHQKQWLGAFAHHGYDGGHALLEEGALRWNRVKRREVASEAHALPQVYAGGLLLAVDRLHHALTRAHRWPALQDTADLLPMRGPSD